MELKKTLLDLVYPVGSFYWSYINTDPGILFGGTWIQVLDKMVWATSGEALQTGGAFTNTTSDSSIASSGSVDISVAASGATTSGYSAPATDVQGAHQHGTSGVVACMEMKSGNIYYKYVSHYWDGCNYYADTNATKVGSGHCSTGMALNGYVDSNGGHAHTVASHAHSIPDHVHTLYNATHAHTINHTHTVSTMPPYITAFCWYRTA